MKISHSQPTPYPGQQPLAASMQTRSDKIQLQTGADTIYQLGASVLNTENIKNWENKGLKIPEEAYKKAFDALNDALSWSKKQDSPQLCSFSFNAYGIVASVQQVPAWFLEEGKRYNQELPPVVAQAFENNQLWFGHLNKVAV